MNEHDTALGAWEYRMPAPESEFTPPAPESEFTPPAPEERTGAPPFEGGGRSGKSTKLKRLIRYAAALTAAGALALTAAPAPEPAPLETVDVEAYIEIECAAVMPAEPDVLRFQYMDYRSLYDEVPTYSEDDFRFYLVTPDGEETELKKEKDPELYRSAYCAGAADHRETAYSAVVIPGGYFNLNVGWVLWRAEIGRFVPGSVLKIVCTYEADGVIKRMTSTREIIMLPEPAERTVTVEATPRRGGLSDVRFEAVLHPTDESFTYVFGDRAISRMGFCTHWYDAEGNDLGDGWLYAVPSSVSWPFPDVWKYGEDFVFIYEGPVQSAAADSAAAYYSLVLSITEESTGWRLSFESELIPIPAKGN
ncbi:MAG: hypothetical protein IJJ43_02965 [Oscillospiraceae bacterium]|nr:hypothetical protein [Oscillospiraceae bacterium]